MTESIKILIENASTNSIAELDIHEDPTQDDINHARNEGSPVVNLDKVNPSFAFRLAHDPFVRALVISNPGEAISALRIIDDNEGEKAEEFKASLIGAILIIHAEIKHNKRFSEDDLMSAA